jgi:hypothetical protein
MTMQGFRLSPWNPAQIAELDAWGHDRRSALQSGLDAALALMLGEDVQQQPENGPRVPLRGEGDTTAALFGDLLDDLLAQIAVHGHIQAAALDGVLTRDRQGFVAWGYLSPQVAGVPLAMFERVGDVNAVVETSEEVRLRVTLRRLA